MATLNRPLTEAEVIMLRDSISAPCPPGIDWLAAMYEPRHCRVYYHAGRHTYINPEHFYWSSATPSPSDCEWMVPGTVHERHK